MKQVTKKVIEEEKRSANLTIYGLPDQDGENIVKAVKDIYVIRHKSMNVPLPKEAIDCYRIGRNKMKQ